MFGLNLDSLIVLPLRSFFIWWGEQLNTFIPEGVKQFLGQATEHLIVKKDQTAITLYLANAKGKRFLSELSTEDSEDNEAAVKRIFSKHAQLNHADVILELKSSQVLTRDIQLPLAARSNLSQVVAYELDRYTPFNADQVYYDVQVTGKNNETGQMTALLAVVPRQKLDDLCEDLIASGLHPTAARVESGDKSGVIFNLLPSELRPKKNARPKILSFVIGAVLIVLLLGLLWIPIWSDQALIKELEQEMARIGKDANEVQTLKKSVETQMHETNFLLSKKRSEPVLVYMLDDLTKRMPNGTWLTYLQYKNGNLQVRGESADASSLIAVIEDSPLFQNTRFVSPVTRNSASNTDRFQLSMDVLNGGVFDRNTE
ncbi:MAG: PilN domain-containing protein [Gammaproteobacteria bacterium]|nr:PilN domain-containing protein [Gammaproteobacteria bacterium]